MKKKLKDPKEQKMRRVVWFLLLIAIFVFAIDHFFKNICKTGTNFLFIYIKRGLNTGAAFSLLSNVSWARILLIIVGILVLILIAILYLKNHKNKLLKVAFAFIFAGTISNTLDRLFLGYVVDCFTLTFWKTFPAFNIADLINLTGVILVLIFLFKKKNDKRRNN